MNLINRIHTELWKVKIWIQENQRCFKYHKEINENIQFKDKYKGKRCFIIGNGPSLNIEDLNKLYYNKEISFAANRIYTLYNKTLWRPTYYAVCDKLLYANNKKDIDGIQSQMFIPLDIFESMMKEKKANVHLFSRQPFQFFKNKPRINPNLTSRLSEGGTITYHLLQIAIYMGFSELYLLGNDFNYSFGIGPDGKYFENPNVNDHFEGDSQKLANMPNLYYNMKAFESALQYAKKSDIKIYNATRGGNLEVFERKNFDDLFNLNKNDENSCINTYKIRE